MYFKIKQFFDLIYCVSIIKIGLNRFGDHLIVKLLFRFWNNIYFLYTIKSCVLSTQNRVEWKFWLINCQFVIALAKERQRHNN